MNRPEWTPVVSDENIMNLERAVSGFGIETNYFISLLSKAREIIKEYEDEMHDYGGTRRAAVNKFIDELDVFLNKTGNQVTEILDENQKRKRIEFLYIQMVNYDEKLKEIHLELKEIFKSMKSPI